MRWADGALEQIDLELDVLRSVDGTVRVRDRETFDRVRETWAMPADIAARADETCERLCRLVAQGAEPFGTIGHAWLFRFLAEADATISGWIDAQSVHRLERDDLRPQLFSA